MGQTTFPARWLRLPRKPVARSDVAGSRRWPRFASRAWFWPEHTLSTKCSRELSGARRNQPVCVAEWPRMSASPPGPIFVYSPATSVGGHRDGPTWAAVPVDPESWETGIETPTRRQQTRPAVDASPCRGLGQCCVSTPSEGLGAPFTPCPAPPHPSPSAPRFPTEQPICCPVVPPTIHRVSLDSTGTRPFKKCSLLPSYRGAMCPCISYESAPSAPSLPNSNSCTGPPLGGDPPIRQ